MGLEPSQQGKEQTWDPSFCLVVLTVRHLALIEATNPGRETTDQICSGVNGATSEQCR